MTALITTERLREVLNYDQETGKFTWLVRLSHRVEVGDVAGTTFNGYRHISIDGRRYRCARLSWKYVTGHWPGGFVDHLDTNSLNDRFSNLRDASRLVNSQNLRSPRSDNKVGMLGVVAVGDRFRSVIKPPGKRLHLGYFDTPEEAHAAYVAAKRIHHEGCTI